MKAARNDKVTRELSTKQKNRNRNIRLIIVSALISLVVFIALLIVQSNILDMEEAIRVYVVSNEVEADVKITEENYTKYFTVAERTVNTLPDNYIKEGEGAKLLDKFTGRKFVKNEVVTSDYMEDRESVLADIKKPVEVSFSVSTVNAVAGTLREGDFVNIYTSKDGKVNEFIGKGYLVKSFNGEERITTENKTARATMFTIIIEQDIEKYFFENSGYSIRMSKILYE